jgi:hypothetical protein
MSEITEQLRALITDQPWGLQDRLLFLIERLESEENGGKQRTITQNNSIHLYLTQLADELNQAGLDMKQVITVPIEWDMLNCKRYLWKPIQKALLHKDSTTQLTKHEVSRVYDHLNRLLGQKFQLHIPFPDRSAEREQLARDNHKEIMDNYPMSEDSEVKGF